MANIITLYRQFSNDIALLSGFDVDSPKFLFTSEGKLKEMDIDEPSGRKQYYLDDVDAAWDTRKDDLKLRQRYSFSNVSALFGDKGLLSEDGEIGVAAHLYSPTSGYQDNVSFGQLNVSQSSGDFILRKDFEPAFLKGALKVEVYLYVKKLGQSGPFFADMVGAKLGTLHSFEIIVDGDGAVFPIVEVEKDNQPLWSLIVAPGTDFSTDQFSADNVRLEFNKKHDLFKALVAGKQKLARYVMLEIMTNAMTQLIYIGKNELESLSSDDYVQGSLGSIIGYWIETFELDIDSFAETNHQLRAKLEESIMKGGKDDD